MKRLIIMCGLVAAMASVAWAKSGYLSTFNTQYGTSRTRLDSCTLCQVSGSNSRNVYGRAFGTALSANNATVQSALTAIENQDSDGDHAANILEINARTLPGDPQDVPVTPGTVESWSTVKARYRS